ncbi:Histidine kinase-, DNA gyrase B-, and HSP90-like ATPase [Tenacibaculum sp. MAR_2009_124]|uniref:sensor histidine kinase n=1 Tax=Tenacibaculum sp. MAR_2009_124 TaxID=1250059 RepID=UPI00089585BB|nr:ATP-binding protein [Tenacibaculum sp. MAR_2009_124]SEB67290.1 Histidine kinase-, DNA gyrase B-, and HSP90-like ATPase [Tenacibaculum sp. MAR_2009_124]
MDKSFFWKLGKLKSFEIRNNSLILRLISPTLYLYIMLILYLNPSIVILPYAKGVFAILFLVIGALPLLKKEKIIEHYGVFVFFAFFSFQYFLTYTLAENNFAIDCILGTYIVMFGGILTINNNFLLLFFSAFQLLHMIYRVSTHELDATTELAILGSTTSIFTYSFIILNGTFRHRKKLEDMNSKLGEKIKKRTQELENRAKELYESNIDLEDFAFMVSNDLKRPLRSILNSAKWLTSPENVKTNFNGEMNGVYKDLFIIKEQVVQMDMLISGILNYSLHLEKEKKVEKVNLASLLERIIMVNSSENCKIVMKGNFPSVYFNESQLLQVFQNLIQNAIKHNDKDKVYIELNIVEEIDCYVFSVSDNGPGIEKKYHRKIFELFQKLELKKHIDSIGIGLALVRKIVERNGGEVWLESKFGKGTVFFFTIRKH